MFVGSHEHKQPFIFLSIMETKQYRFTMVKIAKDQVQLAVAVTYSVYMLWKKLLSQGTSL